MDEPNSAHQQQDRDEDEQGPAPAIVFGSKPPHDHPRVPTRGQGAARLAPAAMRMWQKLHMTLWDKSRLHAAWLRLLVRAATASVVTQVLLHERPTLALPEGHRLTSQQDAPWPQDTRFLCRACPASDPELQLQMSCICEDVLRLPRLCTSVVQGPSHPPLPRCLSRQSSRAAAPPPQQHPRMLSTIQTTRALLRLVVLLSDPGPMSSSNSANHVGIGKKVM